MRVKIYVIDNGSKDRTIPILEKVQQGLHYAALEIISLPANKGTTISRNIGLKKACRNSSYICILDSDTVVNEQAMKSLMRSLKEHHDIGIIGPVMKGLDGTVQNYLYRPFAGKVSRWNRFLKRMQLQTWDILCLHAG